MRKIALLILMALAGPLQAHPVLDSFTVSGWGQDDVYLPQHLEEGLWEATLSVGDGQQYDFRLRHPRETWKSLKLFCNWICGAGEWEETTRRFRVLEGGFPPSLRDGWLRPKLSILGSRMGRWSIRFERLSGPGLKAPEPGPSWRFLGGFEVRVSYENNGWFWARSHAADLGDRTAAFWFFEPENVEVFVKILDGCAINGYHWLFASSLSDLPITIEVDGDAMELPFEGIRNTYWRPCG